MKKIFAIGLLIFCLQNSVQAQDTLPNFNVRDLGKGKAQISWINPYAKLVQLTVQRSFDSTNFFKTIFSTQSPWLPQNGFIDNNLPIGYKVYYRIQYVFEGGAYYFTKSKSPGLVSNKVIKEKEVEPPKKPDTENENRIIKIYKPEKPILIAEVFYKNYKKYEDSILKNTKDTLEYIGNDEIVIIPYVPKVVWKASTYIYSTDKGFLRINIPQAKQHKYSIIIFEENGTEFLHIKHVKDTDLVLDKSNFIHAGWYLFELYQNDKLIEKNKFYLSKDK